MSFSARLYDSTEETPLPRSRTHLTGSLTPLVLEPHNIVVHNLSSEGLLVESYHAIPVGSDVMFEIADLGKVSARVVWREGHLYDCTFTEPLPSQLVHSKLRQSNVVWGNFPSLQSMETEALLSVAGRIAPPTSAERWPPLARVSFIVVSASGCWFAIFGLYKLITHLL